MTWVFVIADDMPRLWPASTMLRVRLSFSYPLAAVVLLGGCLHNSRYDVSDDESGGTDSDGLDGLAPEDSDAPGREDDHCERTVAPTPAPATTSEAPFRVDVHPFLEVGQSDCLAVEDLNGNGNLDVMWISETSPQGEKLPQPRLFLAPNADFQNYEMIEWPGVGQGRFHHCLIHDVDEDGRLDLLLGVSRGLVWSRQSSDGSFDQPETLFDLNDIPGQEGMEVTSFNVMDVDGLGRLDLILAVHPATIDASGCEGPSNRSDGVVTIPNPFTRSAEVHCLIAETTIGFQWAESLCPSPVLAAPAFEVFDLAVQDFNQDGRDDLLIVNDFSTNRLLLGSEGGGLKAPGHHTGLEVYNHGMGSAIADFSGNGLLDVYISDIGVDSIHEARDCLLWFDANRSWNLGDYSANTITWGVVAEDFDLNGAPDLFVANSADASYSDLAAGLSDQDCVTWDFSFLPRAAHRLLLGEGDGQFRRVDVATDMFPPHATGDPTRAVVGDLNGDGRLDLIVSHWQGGAALYNQIPTNGHWIELVVHGSEGTPAVGASVTVHHRDGGRRRKEIRHRGGLMAHSPLRAHFGLGGDSEPVSVDVVWPDGQTTRFSNLDVDRRYFMQRP